MQREHFHQQTQKNDTLYQASATNTQCVISTEKTPEQKAQRQNMIELELTKIKLHGYCELIIVNEQQWLYDD